MRIIKEGKIPEDKVYQFTCDNCETIFEFTRADSTIRGKSNWISVKCPLCKKKIIVEK